MRDPGDAAVRAKVLVVDGLQLVGQALARAIDVESDLTVVGVTTTVRGARRATIELRPDVVLIGDQLADGTGCDATTLIRSELPDARIVMLGTNAGGASVAQALSSGCSGFVTREGLLTDMIDTLRATLAGRVTVPPWLGRELGRYLRPAPQGLGADLSVRERDVVSLLGEKFSIAEIADELVIRVGAVRGCVRSILLKLQVPSRVEAVAVASRLGLIRPTECRDGAVRSAAKTSRGALHPRRPSGASS